MNRGFSNTEFLDAKALQIINLTKTAGVAFYEVGCILVEVINTQIPKGEILKFYRRVGLHPKTAQDYIRVAKAPDGKELAAFGIAKARKLLQLPLEKRQSFLTVQNPHTLTDKDLDVLIKKELGQTQSAKAKKTTKSKRQSDDLYAQGWEAGYQDGLRDGYAKGKSEASAEAKQNNESSAFAPNKKFWAMAVLGISGLQGMTQESIHRIRRDLLVIVHPDRHPESEKATATILAQRVNEAADFLIRQAPKHSIQAA
jgi:curved DNA-binding protein CbpA